MTRNIREHMEVEIALLAGVLGFFLGGLLNVKKEILDIVLAAVITGALVFFISYYAMILIFSGAKKNTLDDEYGFHPVDIDKIRSGKNAPNSRDKNAVKSPDKAAKGKKLDLISSDDNLYEDLYKK